MAVASSALTSLANAKGALGIATADTSKDTLIEQYIDRATAQIETGTERKLKARNFSGIGSTAFATTSVASEDYIHFSGTTLDRGGDTNVSPEGYGVFYLPQYPIQTVSPSVTFGLHALSNRATSDWDTSSLVENRDYIVDSQSGTLTLLGGRFTPGVRNYRITCTAGYITIPADLEQACIALVKKLLRNESGVTSESLGTWSRSFDVSKADELVQQTLSLYRRFSF